MRRTDRRLREPRRVRPVWTVEQFQTVLQYCINEQWRLAVLLMLNGVARRRTIEAIRLDQIDLDAGTIHVRESKTGKERFAPLHPKVLTELCNYIAELPAGQSRLFTQTFRPETWKRICRRAGVPHITMHHLRTVMSTWLQRAGVPVEAVAAVLDHCNPDITKRWYSQCSADALRAEAVKRLPL